MKLEIRLAAKAEKSIISAFMAEYFAEMRAYEETDDDYPYFDLYWSEANRWPYLISFEGKDIGFAFINNWSPSGKGTDYSFAEFFILKAYRKQGLARYAAAEILQMHNGFWELRIAPKNTTALHFWQAVITSAQAENVEKLETEEDLIFRFRLL